MEILTKEDLERDFKTSDIGKSFWKTEVHGTLTEHYIDSINADDVATMRLKTIISTKDEDYVNVPKEEQYFYGSVTYAMHTLRNYVLNNPNYFLNLDEALEASAAKYEKEVNPNGQYKVARYFDDVFETYMKDPITKEDMIYNKKGARTEAARLNGLPRAYVSYGIKVV